MTDLEEGIRIKRNVIHMVSEAFESLRRHRVSGHRIVGEIDRAVSPPDSPRHGCELEPPLVAPATFPFDLSPPPAILELALLHDRSLALAPYHHPIPPSEYRPLIERTRQGFEPHSTKPNHLQNPLPRHHAAPKK